MTDQPLVIREVTRVRFTDGSFLEMSLIVKLSSAAHTSEKKDTLLAFGPPGSTSYRFLRDALALETTGVSRLSENALTG